MDAAAPLVGLDAVVIDTETTGLDTRSARIVQMAAVRIVKGSVVADEPFVTLVDPGQPIPAASTAIHGLADADVAGAPGFVEAYAAFRAYVGFDMLVGHTVAFDLAVIGGECGRTGLPYRPLPALDTALLAEVANPGLAGTGIETLAAWLGVEVVGRHTAPGDALTTARIFAALVPYLRDRGIRTCGEAEAACRELVDARAAAGRASLGDARGIAVSERPLARIDAYPFRHFNRDLMSSPPRVIGPDAPIGDAIATMTGNRVSSLFVSGSDGAPRAIVTERDVMRAIAAGGAAALGRPVGEIASAPLVAVAAGDHIHRAIGRMSALGIRHLAVAEPDGTIVGALSARDLLRLRASEAITLGDAIDNATDVGALAAAWARLPAVAAALLDEDVAAIDIAAIVSREIAAMTARAAVIGEARMAEAGEGPPPADYAVLVLGSVGRGESLLAADQDNAIVFAEGDDVGFAGAAASANVGKAADDVGMGVGKIDAWFADIGLHVADILHECGIPRCKGGVMARNPEWRRPLSGWKATVDRWVTRSNPRDLLLVDIFFDLACAHGATALADEIWRYSYDSAAHHADFAKLLAEASSGFQPPITFLGGLRTEGGRVDLKAGGLLPIVSGARVLSICHHLPARATPERLVGIRRLGIGGAGDLDNLVEVHRLILDHMLRQQVEDIGAGVPPSNKVDIRRLSPSRRNELRDALKSLRGVETMVRDMIFAKPLGGREA
jgi:DNA polymerase-3 subunit epsilon/CBS domain-containing protein